MMLAVAEIPVRSASKRTLLKPVIRYFSLCRKTNGKTNSAIVVGCFEDLKLSSVGRQVDEQCEGKLTNLLQCSNFKAQPGKTRIFYGLNKDFPCIAVAGLGKEEVVQDEIEGLDVKKENVRVGISAAVKELQNLEIQNAEIDHCSEPTAAAEAATLSSFIFDQLKSKKTKKPMTFTASQRGDSSTEINDHWNKGIITAECQNFARHLMELPANYKTPTLMADLVLERMSPCKGVEVIIRGGDEKTLMGDWNF